MNFLFPLLAGKRGAGGVPISALMRPAVLKFKPAAADGLEERWIFLLIGFGGCAGIMESRAESRQLQKLPALHALYCHDRLFLPVIIGPQVLHTAVKENLMVFNREVHTEVA